MGRLRGAILKKYTTSTRPVVLPTKQESVAKGKKSVATPGKATARGWLHSFRRPPLLVLSHASSVLDFIFVQMPVVFARQTPFAFGTSIGEIVFMYRWSSFSVCSETLFKRIYLIRIEDALP